MDDAENRTPTPGETGRRLIRSLDRAVLSTALADGGWPFGSLVLTACDHRAAPLLLISDLAEHTRNLAREPRASLLFDGTVGLDSPLTGARVSVLGTLRRTEDDALRARFLRRHPDAGIYAGFADFHLYAMAVERAHLVAGFGDIHWIGSAGLQADTAGTEALAAAEADIVAHMNGDHGEAVALYATRLLGRADGAWTMTGIDPEGADLRLGGTVARVAFAAAVRNADEARRELVRLVDAARAA